MRFTLVFLVLALAVMVTKALCPCPKIYNPLCASNGRTYINPCLFECVVMEAKRQGDENAENELFVIHTGRCSDDPGEYQKEDNFLNLYK
ncbi:serine protease inhibitor dipetalogastin-like [Belonocnema kinseyi]|uniref:serine protease inhibitor dipetalogastin-like n=1 Tax=Belonocnema kinseyi TaxID=2817044 RepID=UPI00143DB458|nr:serine protease inhibitor dipetalogastin-like [Belonocnema kinseyi]